MRLPSIPSRLCPAAIKLLNTLVKRFASQLLRIDRLANRWLGFGMRGFGAPSGVNASFVTGVGEQAWSQGKSLNIAVRRLLFVVATMALALLFVTEAASAQGWWPFGGGGGGGQEEDRPPIRRNRFIASRLPQTPRPRSNIRRPLLPLPQRRPRPVCLLRRRWPPSRRRPIGLQRTRFAISSSNASCRRGRRTVRSQNDLPRVEATSAHSKRWSIKLNCSSITAATNISCSRSP